MHTLVRVFVSALCAFGHAAGESYEKAVTEILPVGKARSVAVTEVQGKGPGAEQWETGCQRVQTGLERAISARKDDLKLIERRNLAAVEQENALTGKATRIQAADVLVAAQLMAISGKVVVSLTATEVKTQNKQTTDIELDPADLGINLETDLAEADAKVRTLNARTFDITRNLVKRNVLDEAFPPGASDSASKMAEKRRAVLDRELKEWGETTAEEAAALARLAPDMVDRALTDRHEYLVVEGRIRAIDTTRQLALLAQLQRMITDIRKSGIEPTATSIIESCRKVVEEEEANSGV